MKTFVCVLCSSCLVLLINFVRVVLLGVQVGVISSRLLVCMVVSNDVGYLIKIISLI